MRFVESKASVWPSPDHELLLRAALADPDAAARAFKTWSAKPRSSALDLGTRQLLPAVYRNLHPQGGDGPWIEALAGWHAATRTRNRLLFARLKTILDLLHGEDIVAIIVKGAALVPLYYRDDGARTVGDLDLLVRPERFREATQLLAAEGWRAIYHNPEFFDDRFEHAIAFADGQGDSVDLHCHLLIGSCQPGADDSFWEGSQPFEVSGTRTRTLSTTDHLLHALVHGMTWGKSPSPRWVADAVTISRASVSGTSIDWGRLVRIARELRLMAAVAPALGYVRDRFGVPVPSDVFDSIRMSPVSGGERRRMRLLASPLRGHPIRLLRSHWSMYRRGSAGEGTIGGLVAVPQYLRFWAQTDRLWKIGPRLGGKALRVVAHRLGMYRYWDD